MTYLTQFIHNFTTESVTLNFNILIFVRSCHSLKAKIGVCIAPCVPQSYKTYLRNDNCGRTHNNQHVSFRSHTHLAMIHVLFEKLQLVIKNDTNTNHEA